MFADEDIAQELYEVTGVIGYHGRGLWYDQCQFFVETQRLLNRIKQSKWRAQPANQAKKNLYMRERYARARTKDGPVRSWKKRQVVL